MISHTGSNPPLQIVSTKDGVFKHVQKYFKTLITEVFPQTICNVDSTHDMEVWTASVDLCKLNFPNHHHTFFIIREED